MSGSDANVVKRQDEVWTTLQTIRAMLPEQRLTLFKAWTALESDLVGQAGEPHSSGNPDESSIDLGVQFTSWIEETRRLSTRQQMVAFSAALDEEADPLLRDVIEKEIASVRNADRWLAVETAAVDYAQQHPVLVLLSLVGAGLLLYSGARSIFRVIF